VAGEVGLVHRVLRSAKRAVSHAPARPPNPDDVTP
jgi:hypothetical protein